MTFTPAPNATGVATVGVTVQDNGGTANGGVDTSAPQTFLITVTPVNAAPSFIKGADQTVLEDAAAQTVPNWATAISAGAPGESAQILNFLVSDNNGALFSTPPSVSPTGTLTYTPAADANGSATVTVQLHDSGGTASGGIDTSAPQTFTITVTQVNDAPSFAKGADQSVTEAGAHTVEGWAGAISVGPANESAQTASFIFTGNDNPGLFTIAPAVSPSGTLTYSVAATANGIAHLTFVLKDNGGTSNGGQDTSAPATFSISAATNHAPQATDDHYVARENTPLVTTATCAPVSYASFGAASGLTLNGNSTIVENVLRLVPADTFQRGSAFTSTPVGVATFNTSFTFQMSGNGSTAGPDGFDGQGAGADGIMFVLQNAGPAALGGPGGRMGYGLDPDDPGAAIAPSVGVEFDTFQNGEYGDADTNHVGINVNGSVFSVQAQGVEGRFDDGRLWTAWLDYDGTTLEVRVSASGSRPEFPTLSRTIDIPTILGGQTAYAGFTSATGLDFENADVLSWTYSGCQPGVLSNDTDSDGNPLTAVLVQNAEHGALTLNPDGSFTYIPFEDFVGIETFRYVANDGLANSNLATVTIAVAAVTASADLQVTQTDAGFDPGQFGVAIGYNSTIRNNGPSAATGVVLTDTVPADLSFSGYSSPDGIVCDIAGGVVTCQIGTLAPSASVSVMLGLIPNVGSGSVTNTVSVTSDGPDPNPANNTATESTTIVATVTAVPDVATTTTAASVTIAPGSNDLQAGVTYPSVLQTIRPFAGGVNLANPTEVAVVSATGLAYFGATNNGSSVARIGILDTATNAIVGSIALASPAAGLAFSRVNQTTGIVYFRVNPNVILAVDGRPTSGTFNQVIAALTLGSTIQSFAIDETRGLMYITNQTTGSAGTVFESQISGLDVDPASPTFHQIIGSLVIPNGATARGVAVNTTTNKVYIATSSGLWLYNGNTDEFNGPIANSSSFSSFMVVVNEAQNLVYGTAAGNLLFAVDGANDSPLALLTMPGSVTNNLFERRIAITTPPVGCTCEAPISRRRAG